MSDNKMGWDEQALREFYADKASVEEVYTDLKKMKYTPGEYDRQIKSAVDAYDMQNKLCSSMAINNELDRWVKIRPHDILISEGAKLPEHLVTRDYMEMTLQSWREHAELIRTQRDEAQQQRDDAYAQIRMADAVRGLITDAMGTKALNRMESDLGKVRAAIGDDAFNRIVGDDRV